MMVHLSNSSATKLRRFRLQAVVAAAMKHLLKHYIFQLKSNRKCSTFCKITFANYIYNHVATFAHYICKLYWSFSNKCFIRANYIDNHVAPFAHLQGKLYFSTWIQENLSLKSHIWKVYMFCNLTSWWQNWWIFKIDQNRNKNHYHYYLVVAELVEVDVET